MRTSDGHPFFQAHQLGQHDRARHHRYELGMGRHHLGVVGMHSGRGDHGIGPCDVGLGMADLDAHAQGAQSGQGRAFSQV